MKEISRLMAKYCPNGVKYKLLKEISLMQRGTSTTKKEITQGNIPVISGGREPAYYCNVANRTGQTITVAGSGVGAGYVQYWQEPIFVCDAFSIQGTEGVNTRYVYHFLASIQEKIYATKKGGGIPHVHISSIADFKIPVPPLPVQKEIVRILDNFTALTSEIKARLTAELTLRKKQYEYYRDKMLTFENKIHKVRLGDIATEIYRGNGIKREQITPTGIPCVRYGEIYTTYNTWFDKCISHTKPEYIQNPKYFEHGDILFAITGESVADIAKSVAYVGHGKCLAGGDIVVLKHKQNPKYLAYALSTYNAAKQKSKGKIKSKVVHSSVPAIAEIEIPLPPLDVQERLVNVLDNFEAICSDLNIGLPAEIEARRRQYEFYRDFLLNFNGNCGIIEPNRTEPNRTEPNRTEPD